MANLSRMAWVGILLLLSLRCGAQQVVTNVSVFFPDNDPFEFNGRTILLPRGEYRFRIHQPARGTGPYPCLFFLGGGAGELPSGVGDRWVMIEVLSADEAEERAVAGFICAHDNLLERVGGHPGLKFIAGAGENAGRAVTLAGRRSGFCGAACFDAAGEFETGAFGMNTNFLVFCAGGDGQESNAFMRGLPEFAWATHEPAADMARGLEWMEEQVFIEWPHEDSLRDEYRAALDRWMAEAAVCDGARRSALSGKARRLAERRDLRVPRAPAGAQ